MNKLVIIGNGFDLAHGLPTSYAHFINDFWGGIKVNYKNDDYKKLVFINELYCGFLDFNAIENYSDFQNSLKQYSKEYGYSYVENEHLCIDKAKHPYTNIFKFKNQFFKEINIKSIENWVDIEAEYYKKLKQIVKHNSLEEQAKKEHVLILNKEFCEVKILLENYLFDIIARYNFNTEIPYMHQITNFFKIKPLHLGAKHSPNTILKEFPKEDHEDLIKYDNELLVAEKNGGHREDYSGGEIIHNNIFLNFNYTPVIHYYIKYLNYGHNLNWYGNNDQIQIHGTLKNNDNSVNFGFGDEMDEDYRIIENLDDNEYLKNFKSFQYTQNSNYKTLLDFIDGSKYQVYIMGHSCGLSDRTMLNTIFEHENCRSIKVFYHKRDDDSDNYTDVIQNISRHFKDKKLMRSKIVNKSLCLPFPQNIRFKEK